MFESNCIDNLQTHFKISTHHTNTKKTTLASNQTKNRLQTLSSHIQNTHKSTTYIFLQYCLSFPSHSVSTRSSDSLVLSIPYVRSSLGKRAFSVIGPLLWNSLPPDTRNSNSLPTFCSRLKTHLFKIAFPPWLFPISLDCLPGFWFLLFSFYALSNDT